MLLRTQHTEDTHAHAHTHTRTAAFLPAWKVEPGLHSPLSGSRFDSRRRQQQVVRLPVQTHATDRALPHLINPITSNNITSTIPGQLFVCLPLLAKHASRETTAVEEAARKWTLDVKAARQTSLARAQDSGKAFIVHVARLDLAVATIIFFSFIIIIIIDRCKLGALPISLIFTAAQHSSASRL